jgi:hypothetical protein
MKTDQRGVPVMRRGGERTHVFNQLDRILVHRQIHDRPVSADVEDGVEIGRGEGGEFDGVLDELLGGGIVEELGAEVVVLECFHGGLREGSEGK